MAFNIGSASIAIGASTGGLQQGLSQAQGQVSSFTDGLKAKLLEATSSWAGLAKAVISAGIAIGTYVFAKNFWDTANSLKEAQKEASAFGVSLQYLQGLQGTGVDVGAMTTGLRQGARQIEQAEQGSANAIRNLRMVGLEVRDIANLNPEQQYQKMFEAIAQMPAGMQRTTAAQALLGRGALQMKELFNQGADALKKSREHSEAIGLVLSSGQEQSITKMNNTWREVGLQVKGIWNQLVSNLAPIMTTIGNIMSKIWSILQPIVSFVTSIIGAGWEILSTTLGVVWQTFEGIATSIGSVLMPIVNVFKDAFVGAISFIVNYGIRPLIRVIGGIASWIPGLGGLSQGAKDLDQMFDRLVNGSQQAAQAQGNLAQQVASSNNTLQADLRGISDGLEKTHRQFGMTAEEKKIDDLTERMRRLGHAIDANNQSLINRVQASADMNLGQQIASQVDPTIKLQQEMTRLQRVYDNGGLSAAHFALQQNHLLQQAERTLGLSKEFKAEHAIEAGSSKAYEIIAKFNMGDMRSESVQERMLAVNQAQQAIQQQMLEAMRANNNQPQQIPAQQWN